MDKINCECRWYFCKYNVPLDINTEPSSVNDVNTEANIFVNNESHNNSVYSQPGTNINLSTASASSQKIQDFVGSIPKETDSITGNRIIDTRFCLMWLVCYYAQGANVQLCHLVIKQGLASLLFIKCVTQSCKFINEFYTSLPSGRGFDVNKRTAYTMRVLGHGHSDLEKFTSLMNMPKPMTQNNYDKIILKISNVTKAVAEETVRCSNRYIYIYIYIYIYCNNVVDTGVSCDSTWQRRGFSSLNGVFAAISIDSGKMFDVEPMSRSCKSCFLKGDLMKTEPTSNAEWRHFHICKYNYIGSAGGMEPEGAKRVFDRSVTKDNLRWLGD